MKYDPKAWIQRILRSLGFRATMTTVSITFENCNSEPIFLQVDPWAGFYLLKKGDKIEIIAESDDSSPRFDVDEQGTTRILTIVDSTEYFVVIGGERIHWEKYYLDSRLCPKCLGLMNSEEESLKICRCGQGAS